MKVKGTIVVGFFLVGLVCSTQSAYGKDLADIITEAKAKYAEFEKTAKDLTIEGEVKTSTPHGEMTARTKTFKKGKKFRMETTIELANMPEMPPEMAGMAGMETIVIFDGKDVWSVSPFTGKRKLTGEEKKGYETDLNWWDLISKGTELAGSDRVDGRECYVIEAKEDRESPYRRMWLDKKSLALVKAESKDTGGRTALWVHSDFREVAGGWEMPFLSEMYAGEDLVTLSVIESMEINQRLSDHLFDPERIQVEESDMQKMMRDLMKGTE